MIRKSKHFSLIRFSTQKDYFYVYIGRELLGVGKITKDFIGNKKEGE